MPDTAATTAAFVRDICADPGDDTVRLIYADWLEEQGQRERAELIRIQCELAREETRELGDDPAIGVALRAVVICARLRHRERELLTPARFWDWFGNYVSPLVDSSPGSPAVSINGAACTVGYFNGESVMQRWTLTIQRGFVESVTLPCADFLAHGPQIVSQTPLRVVTLTDVQIARVKDREPDLPTWRVIFPDARHPKMRAFWSWLRNFPWSHSAWEAHQWLSAAALAWARREAGLPSTDNPQSTGS